MRLSRFAALAGPLALALVAACGGPPIEAPVEGAVDTALPWERVELDAYDTLVGTGFRQDKFVAQWGGFGDDGRHRPDLSEVEGETLGRPLTIDERLHLESVYDLHEPMVREAAAAAYDTLREALDATWTMGDFHRKRTSDLDQAALDAQTAFDEIGAKGGYTYCDTFTTGGWEVRVVVRSPEHPGFHTAFRELRRAVRARDRDAADFVDGLG